MLFIYKNLRIFAFSDTLLMHHKLEIPADIDVLICVGDVVSGFSEKEFPYFIDWYKELPAQLRLFVAGNHKPFFDQYPQRAKSFIPEEIVFLENSSFIFQDVHFCSVVARPYLKYEVELPDNVDFLITHAPIKGILDTNIGCPKLRSLVVSHPPKYHLFGHIHPHGLQQETTPFTTFCNVSYFEHLRDAYVKDLVNR